MVFARLPTGRAVYCHDEEALLSLIHTFPNAYIHNGRQIIHSLSLLHPDQEVRLCLRIKGGKGGFGSNLRAQGNRLSAKHRSGNYESCRDLATGRRLREIQRAKVIKEYNDNGGDEAVQAAKQEAYRIRLEAKVKRLEGLNGIGRNEKIISVLRESKKEAEKFENLNVLQKQEKGKEPIVCGWEDKVFLN